MKLRFSIVSMQGMLLITDEVFGTPRDKRTDAPKLQHGSVSIAVIVWPFYRAGAEGEGSSCSPSNPLLRENS